jgi:hypothetical protein
MNRPQEEEVLAQRTHLRQLPPKDSGYRSAGYGSGELCALCDLPLEKSEAKYVVEWRTPTLLVVAVSI